MVKYFLFRAGANDPNDRNVEYLIGFAYVKYVDDAVFFALHFRKNVSVH